MAYVLNIKGLPLMPTSRHGMVRNLLNDGKAKVVSRCPFTIQLNYETADYIQEVSSGIDQGYDHIGVSATTEAKVLFEGICELRSDAVKNISSGRESGRSGRNGTLRYREPGFNNRKRESGWLPPSVKSGPDCHINIIEKLRKFLPVGKVNVEIAKFDIQKIKNPDIKGAEYQQGEQLNFWNVREYVSARDGHVCRCCKGKSKDRILNVHHLESGQTGSDAPGNLITLGTVSK